MFVSEKPIPPTVEAQLRSVIETLDEKQAEHMKVLDLRGKSSVTDFMVLATGTSNPHLRALQTTLDDYLKHNPMGVTGVEKQTASGWLVVDAFDIMIHLQTAEMRDFYRLDFLWKDAETIYPAPPKA